MAPPNLLAGGILLAAGIICLVVGVVVWQMRRNSPGAVPLMMLMGALAWWDITYALFWADVPGPTPYFWLDITFIGVTIVPTAVLLFVIQVVQGEQWLKKPFLLALCIEPVLINILMWTDPWHNLFFGGKRELNTASILDAGVASWANIIYSYFLIAVAFVLLARAVIRAKGLYRQQYLTIMAGIGITWVSSLIFTLGFDILSNADNTPFFFTLTGLVFAFALLRLRLLDIVPIARDRLVDNMNDGVMVVDKHNRLVDFNPAARNAIPELKIGEPAGNFLKATTLLVRNIPQLDEIHTEVTLAGNLPTYLDVRISPLFDKQRQPIGKLIVWRDITELKLMQLELKDLAGRDAVTEVYNRRRFMELAQTELRRTTRLSQPLSVVIADLDRFKNVNDTYSHQVGDQVLHDFAQFCMRVKRKNDLFARWGGEEFIFLLPETDGAEAFEFTERLRRLIAETPSLVGPYSITVTASLGVAPLSSPQDTLEMLLSRADQAMYAAKDQGRNCTVLWQNNWAADRNEAPG